MKKIVRIFSLLTILNLMFQSNIFSQDDSLRVIKNRYEYEQHRTLSKSYKISKNDRIEIVTKFGKVEIKKWNNNEVRVDVEFITTAKTEAWAKSVLTDVDLETYKLNNEVMFKTLYVDDLDKKEEKKIGNQRIDKYKGKDTRQTMEVNYVVYVPDANPIKISNVLGAIILPDYSGEVELDSQNGLIYAGVLNKVKKISVSDGKGRFEGINSGIISLNNSNIEFKKLYGILKMDIKYCNFIKIQLDNRLKRLDINASYSNVNLSPKVDLSSSFNFTTNYSDFKNTTGIAFPSSGGNNVRNYKCKMGTGITKVNVNTSFGSIILGDANPADYNIKING